MDINDLPEMMFRDRSPGYINIYMVRHGDTAYNDDKDEKVRSWDDIPLNDKGITVAKSAGLFLKKRRIDALYSSDLRRTWNTAEIIGTYIDKVPIPDFDLRTMNFGVLDGESVKDTEGTVQYFIDNPDEEIKGGETVNDFHRRAEKVIYKYLVKAANFRKTLALSTHSRIFNMVNHILLKEPLSFDAEGIPPPGGIIRITLDKQLKMERVH